MYILDNVPLSGFSTMRLGGVAQHLTEISDRFEVEKALSWASERNLPIIMIGEGSNIVWRDEGFPGLVLVNKIERFESFNEDNESIYVTGGGGNNWDDFVGRTVQLGLSGLENLSLIPGTVGATPVQNVGAYGREVSEVISTIEAYDTQSGKLVTLRGSDCGFSYRSSRFKTTDKGRYLITAVTYQLSRSLPKPPFYQALADYLHTNHIDAFSPQTIRDAVIAIRSAKLPNPAIVANNGSFFQNPIISMQQYSQLAAAYPGMVNWELDNGMVKISAAWLLEQAGFKDYHDEATGMATWPKQPLVLVNEAATSTSDLIAFKEKIVAKVKQQFDIDLQQEPELLP